MSARDEGESCYTRRECDLAIQRLEMRQAQMALDLAEVKKMLEKYVTHPEFAPVRLLAYGFAGLILVAVISALVASVVTK